LDNGEWSSFTKPVIWRQYIEKTESEDEEKKKRDEENKEKRARMSVLRGVAIRIPLLVYGAEINDEAGEEITIDNFASEEIVDQASWDEFMPKGFKKETFNILKECFDRSIFTGAAKRIRAMVKEADTLNTEDRIAKIATIFSYFHNPDKETVLTPWRVVNMHMSDCLGGWCFYNDQFDGNYTEENEYGEIINAARFVDRGQVTKDVFCNYNARILEINSKTGLYPLYMAYSIFKSAKEPEWRKIQLTGERGHNNDAEQYENQAGNDLLIWRDVLQDNIFVVCRTKMAVSITKRTLAGFRKDIRMNVCIYEKTISGNKFDMIDIFRKRPELFRQDIVKGRDFWHVYNQISKDKNEDINNMKFSAIVGNPPYQLNKATENSTKNSAFASAIYPNFIDVSCDIKPGYVSLITPSRWLTKTGQGLSLEWVDKMLNSNHFMCIHDFANATECFENVEIKGGVNYFLYSDKYEGKCDYAKHEGSSVTLNSQYLNGKGLGIVIRDVNALEVLNRVIAVEGDFYEKDSFANLVSPQHFFDKNGLLTTSWRGYSKDYTEEYNIKYYLNKTLEKSGVAWIRCSDIPKNQQVLPLHKIYIPKVGGSGNDPYVLGKPFYGEPNSVCSQTYLVIGYDEKKPLTPKECSNIIMYIKTRFFRYLVSIKKKTQDNPSSVFQFVPLQDFSRPWNDHELYKKYNLTKEEIAYIENTIKPME
jgi:hypothetical protein